MTINQQQAQITEEKALQNQPEGELNDSDLETVAGGITLDESIGAFLGGVAKSLDKGENIIEGGIQGLAGETLGKGFKDLINAIF